MHASEAKFGWQRGWVIGLALLSLVLPVAAVFPLFPRRGPAVPLADPAGVSDYRLTVAALGLALACALGTFIGQRALRPARLRWLNIVLASPGMLLSAYLLLGLIGTCGVGVIWGVCQP